MKVNQIVSEHKKGVRAMKYAKKPVNPSHLHAKAKEKLEPIKPMEEAVLKAYDGKQATIDDPEHGKTINLDLTKPENAASLKPNDKGELEYDPTPDMGAPGAQPGEPTGPKPGTNVTIKADEEVGAGLSEPPSNKNTYFVDTSKGTPIAKVGSGQPITASTKWPTVTPDVEKKANAQYYFLKYLSVNGKIIPALEGGGKLLVGSQDYSQLTGVKESKASARPSASSDADSALLNKMLTIAGLR